MDSNLFKRLVIGAYPPEIFVAHATTGPTSVLVRSNSFSLEAARRQSKKSAKVASNERREKIDGTNRAVPLRLASSNYHG